MGGAAAAPVTPAPYVAAMLILHPTQQPLVPTRGPADWQAWLADPEKHWKDGRSAKMLAEAWEGA
jgi:hypothetical protein